MLSDWAIRLRSLFRPGKTENDLDDELRFHLEQQVLSYQDAGLTREDAVRRARLEFGGLDQVKEDCREARGTKLLEDTIQDFRFAARLLKKDRWFALAVIVVIALGIGISTSVFTLADGALIRDLPFDRPEQVVALGTHDSRKPVVRGPLGYEGLSYQQFLEWRQFARGFAQIGAYADATMNVSDDLRAPERFRGAYVSANTFRLLGSQPLLGRNFTSEDDRRGAAPVVLLGYRAWQRRYGADRTLLGRAVRVNGEPAVVVGVMPDRFGFPLTADIWQPLAQMPAIFDQPRDARILTGIGRLVDGETIVRAQATLDTIGDRLAQQFPETDSNIRSLVWPYADRHIAPQVRLAIGALMGAVLFVLLIACANVANLLLARAAQRSHEVSVRTSLGATRWRIVRQLLSESLVLGALGSAAGYVLSMVGTRLLWRVLAASNPPYWLELRSGGWTVAFVIVSCIGTVILFGLAPALHTAKTGAMRFGHVPRSSTNGRPVRRWTSALVIAEVAFTLVLLAGAAFMTRSFVRAYSAKADIDTSRLLTMWLDLPRLKYATPKQRSEFVQDLEDRLVNLRTKAAVTIASHMPFDRARPGELAIDSRPTLDAKKPPRVGSVMIGDRFFDTLKIRVLRGRAFGDLDGTPGHETAMVNERLVASYFQNIDPIGHRIRVAIPSAGKMTAAPWLTIIGVVPTVRRDMAADGEPLVYLPYRMNPTPLLALLARPASGMTSLADALREHVRAVDSDLPLFDVQTLDERLAFARWPERVFGSMFVMFAGVGLLLSAVGLYAMTAYSVRQRTQEIGIRMALGATASTVRWLVVKRVLVQLLIGLVLGFPAAFVVGRLPWMGSPDLLVLTAIMFLLVAVAGIASLLPARRATRLNPLNALRYE